jgi:hypothetical protein
LSDRGDRSPKFALKKSEPLTPNRRVQLRSEYVLESLKVPFFSTLNYFFSDNLSFVPRHNYSPLPY